MPYKKSYRKKTYRKKQPASDKRIKKVVKKELAKEIEAKFFDRQMSGYAEQPLLTTANPLQGIVRGTGRSEFIGSKIRPTGLSVRGQVIAGDSPGNMLRLVIIQDKTTSGTPLVGTLFSNLTYPWISPFNADFRDTYNILHDKTFLLSNDGATSAGFLPRNFKVFIPGKKLRQITYTGAGAIDSGTIWMCWISDSSAAVHPTYIAVSRLTYRDA